MRSLALAEALRDGGDEVWLVTAIDPGSLVHRWQREGAAVREITAVIGSVEDARHTGEIAREVRAAWVALDGYVFDGAYRSALGGDARLLLVDDHGVPHLKAELVVNGNLYGRAAMYPSLEGRLLAGPRYAMLRREFRAPTSSGRGDGIILAFGGADPEQRTAPVLEALASRDLRGQVIIGPRQRQPAVLRTLAESLGWEPLEEPIEMAHVLSSAGIAVVGSGTTSLECAAKGVPMVAVRIAANQAQVAAALDELGLAIVADADDPAGVAEAAVRLVADGTRRAAMSERGPRFVDGRGALRVASAMREAVLTVRSATTADAHDLHHWRNDPATRFASFTTAHIAWEDHAAWFERALTSPGTRLLIGELEGSPIGMARFEATESTATMSITIAPEARSRGLAAPLIRAALMTVRDLELERIEAYVRPENVASLRAFAAAGFIQVSDPGRPDAVLMVAPPV